MILKLLRCCLGLLLYFSLSAIGWSQKREILAQDLLKMIAETKGDTFHLENARVITNDVSGSHFWSLILLQVVPKEVIQYTDTIHIYKALDFKNVDLSWNFAFFRFHFHKQVSLENCDNSGLSFIQSTLDSTVYITSSSENSYVTFNGCVVNGELELKNVRLVHLIASQFFNRNSFSDDIAFFEIKSCRFELRDGGSNYFQPAYNISMRDLAPKTRVSLEMFECDFKATGKEIGIDFFITHFSYFNVQNCRFEVPVFLYLAELDRMIVENTQFLKPIDFREIGIPVSAANFSFKQISGKIGVKDTFSSSYSKETTLYRASTNKELSHEKNYNELMAVYSKLLGVYKYRGDQKSYNACYIEMKDIASRKAAFDYGQDPGIERFFEWRLAQFLKTFCDYGTSPVKSLIFSFYLIMSFAGIYFLFPSEEDNLSRRRFSRFITSSVDYFKTDKQLLDFEVERQEGELQNLQFLRQKLEEARKGTPGVISWIGWPFYAWMSVYHRFMIWFYNRADLVKGHWSKLSPGRKYGLGFLVSCYFIFFLLSGLVVRMLNALALSLNVFVTLGYGEISASGAMRYLAVLEGLLGWFLLSIFSVSLIGQVLQ